MACITYTPNKYPTLKYPIAMFHPVARTSTGMYVYPWAIRNFRPGELPTRIISTHTTDIEVVDPNVRVEPARSSLVSGEFFWDSAISIAGELDSTSYPFIPHLIAEASQFLYDCLKWFEEIDRLPEYHFPDDLKFYVSESKK